MLNNSENIRVNVNIVREFCLFLKMFAEMVLLGAYVEWGDNIVVVVSIASVDNEFIWDVVRGNMEVY